MLRASVFVFECFVFETTGVQRNIYAKEVQKFPSKRCFVAVLDNLTLEQVFPHKRHLLSKKTRCFSIRLQNNIKLTGQCKTQTADCTLHTADQGPVARSPVSAINRWLRGIKMYRFPWCLTLVSTNHASSNPGQG